MPIVTLPIRVYLNSQLGFVDKFLKNALRGLQMEVKVCGTTPRHWVQIDVCGEDQEVALRYLTDEIGLCPTNLASIKKFSELKSQITNLRKSIDRLHVDIGLPIDVTVSLKHLQSQLLDGRDVHIKKIVELYGFCENLPLTVKILSNEIANQVEAILSERQLVQYRNWTKSLLDRLIILGTCITDVKLALKKSGLIGDVLDIEPLGLFEQAIECKLGTDARGLVPKIGKKLPKATLMVFSPIKVLEFLDY